jgi:hypothetical protein
MNLDGIIVLGLCIALAWALTPVRRDLLPHEEITKRLRRLRERQ